MIIVSKAPIIKHFLHALNEDVAKVGFQRALYNLLKKTRAKIEVKGLTSKIKETLKKGSGVIVANHPTSAAVLSLISILESRKDIYLVINHKFYGWVPHADKNLIPVYITNRLKLIKDTPLTRLYNGEEAKLNLTYDEEHRNNIESMKFASSKINAGGIVVIFPGFPEKQGTHWHLGIGYILSQVTDINAKVISVYIDEKKWIDYLRLIPYIGLLLPPITFYFHKPITQTKLPKKDPKKITQYLEKEFYSNFNVAKI